MPSQRPPRFGLIPARGESTSVVAARHSTPRAHPRTRGVDKRLVSVPLSFEGSSPHAGSRRRSSASPTVLRGLIPARGESTTPRAASETSSPAHPRTRGVDSARICRTTVAAGSSPHAGSRQRRREDPGLGGGLIPARGESTSARAGRTPATTAHPRTRGVDEKMSSSEVWPMGSSPHAGSRHAPPAHRHRADRLIPARGESTQTTRATPPHSTAHPRTRGVDPENICATRPHQGSSPHAGSRHVGRDRVLGPEGLIPARGEST